MRKGKVPVAVRADASFTILSNSQFSAIARHIAATAPQSGKYANPVVKSAADAVAKDGRDLDVADADADDKQAIADRAKLDRDVIRQRANKDGATFVKISEGVCTTEQEIQSLGLTPRAQRIKGAQAPLQPPAIVTTSSGKVVGGAVAHCKAIRGVTNYRLEISVDPIGANTWIEVPGAHARRKLTGLVSASKYWVRFAIVRGNQQSAWSMPVSVIAR